MLDLTYEQSSGVYIAPLQMQANNGIFVIDDFGRQTSSRPRRCSTAGSSRSTARSTTCRSSYGLKFEIPFDAKIVFSTNLEPEHASATRRSSGASRTRSSSRRSSDDEFDEVLRPGRRRLRRR